MRHPVLDRHQIIGWDIDGTLVDGFNSDFFCAYINAHPKKEHHLITFRNQSWADMVYNELAGIVSRELIASVSACPEDLMIHGVPCFDPVKIAAYLNWKGATAKRLGCTILIDDMVHHVEEGCIRNGVEFYDANSNIDW